MRGRALEANPVGEAIARRHVQDLEPVLATLEVRGVAFEPGPDRLGALDGTSLWPEERGGRAARDDCAERRWIAVHVGTRGLLALLHELLEVVLIVAHVPLGC